MGASIPRIITVFCHPSGVSPSLLLVSGGIAWDRCPSLGPRLFSVKPSACSLAFGQDVCERA